MLKHSRRQLDRFAIDLNSSPIAWTIVQDLEDAASIKPASEFEDYSPLYKIAVVAVPFSLHLDLIKQTHSSPWPRPRPVDIRRTVGMPSVLVPYWSISDSSTIEPTSFG